MGARASKRLMTQCFARGVCRGAVECVNLVDHLEHSDPTAAEAIKTGQVAEMSLHFGLQLLRAATRGEPLPPEREKIQTDTIATNVNKKPIARPQLWTLYGNRGKDPRVEHLSAYEFVRYYHDKESRYPWTLKKHQEQRRQEAAAAVAEGSSSAPSSARTQSLKFHARLTDSGRQKLENKVSRTRLQPGEDYRIREEGGEDWMPLGTGSLVQTHRHNWIIAPRKRPRVPVLFGALGSRNEEENIMKILLLFCPWTSNPQDATDSVPYLSQLKTPDTANWRQALRCAWQNANDGFPTEELRRYVLNYAFVYCLPRQLQPDNDLAANSDNEGLKDVVCHFSKEDLEEAAKTRVRGAGTKEEAAEANDTGPAEQATAATSQQAARPHRPNDEAVQRHLAGGTAHRSRCAATCGRGRALANGRQPEGHRSGKDAAGRTSLSEPKGRRAGRSEGRTGRRQPQTRGQADEAGDRSSAAEVAQQRGNKKQPERRAARVPAAGRGAGAGRIQPGAPAQHRPKDPGATGVAAARQPRHREVARPEVPADALAGRAGLRAGHRLRGHRLPSHERSGRRRPDAAHGLRPQQGEGLPGHGLQTGHGPPHRFLALALHRRGGHGERAPAGAGGPPHQGRRPRRGAVEVRRRRHRETLRRAERAPQRRFPPTATAGRRLPGGSSQVDAAVEQSSRKRCPHRSRASPHLAVRRAGPHGAFSARAMQGRLVERGRDKTSNVIKASPVPFHVQAPAPPKPTPRHPPTASPAPRSWSRCATAASRTTTATISTAVPSKAATCRRKKSVRGNEWWTGPGTRACKRRSSSTPL